MGSGLLCDFSSRHQKPGPTSFREADAIEPEPSALCKPFAKKEGNFHQISQKTLLNCNSSPSVLVSKRASKQLGLRATTQGVTYTA
jgi:hypothetical protein